MGFQGGAKPHECRGQRRENRRVHAQRHRQLQECRDNADADRQPETHHLRDGDAECDGAHLQRGLAGRDRHRREAERRDAGRGRLHGLRRYIRHRCGYLYCDRHRPGQLQGKRHCDLEDRPEACDHHRARRGEQDLRRKDKCHCDGHRRDQRQGERRRCERQRRCGGLRQRGRGHGQNRDLLRLQPDRKQGKEL